MECGKAGHLKCTKEKASLSIPIDTIVKDDLNEFIQKFGSRQGPTSYVGIQSSDSEDNEVRFSFDYIEDVKAQD